MHDHPHTSELNQDSRHGSVLTKKSALQVAAPDPIATATDPETINRLCSLLRELRVSVRIELLILLSRSELDVTSIANALQREVSHVSQHLVFLQRQRWLVVLVQGRHRVYTLSSAVRLVRENGLISLTICEDGLEFGLTLREGSRHR